MLHRESNMYRVSDIKKHGIEKREPDFDGYAKDFCHRRYLNLLKEV